MDSGEPGPQPREKTISSESFVQIEDITWPREDTNFIVEC